MDNAEKLMREMGEAIEHIKARDDYKQRMNSEVELMKKLRADKYKEQNPWLLEPNRLSDVKSYDEIFKLEAMLKEAQIPFVFKRHPGMNGFQICYPTYGRERICSVILHNGSYGREQGLLEIMGLLMPWEDGDDVLGYLTADDVFERIKAHHADKWEELVAERKEKEGIHDEV